MSTNEKRVRVHKPSVSGNLTSLGKATEALKEAGYLSKEDAKIVDEMRLKAVKAYTLKTFGV